jgi:hypothetical protein
MDLSARVLGTCTATHLRLTADAVVLRIGSDTFSRTDLAGVACFNFVAAANLSKILTEELSVKNTREVYEKIAPAALALPHLGAVSLAVLGAAFEAKGLGGNGPLEAWVAKHTANHTVVTFGTFKHRQERDAKKARRAARRRSHRPRIESTAKEVTT